MGPDARKGGGFLEASRRFFARSYAADYLGLALIAILYAPLKIFDEPFHQQFRLNDPRIQHPHAEVERVGVSTCTRSNPPNEDGKLTVHTAMLMIYTIPIPIALILLWTTVLRPDSHKIHPSLLGLGTSILMTVFLTDIIKDAVGRPRPDLLARCQPALDTPHEDLVTVDVCTEQSHHLLHDGWRSFPSGHSSLAFSSLGWLALFLASQTQVLRPRANALSVLVCLAPLLGAVLIAISRLEDYRHDVEDVSVGALLGLAIAYLNWRRYYPALMERECEEPYNLSEHRRGSPSGRFGRLRDEEEGSVDDSGER